MKKYLRDLEEELRKNNLREDEINEILADHKEMIQSAKNEGLSDDELNEKFGNPKDVAEELSDFSEQVDDEKKDKKDKEPKTAEMVFDDVKDNYNVEIGLINEDIKIKPTEGKKIILEIFGNIKIDKYQVGFENNRFYLESPKGFKTNYFGFNSKKKFFLYLPIDFQINETKVKLINGDAKIRSIVSKQMELTTNNGNLQLEKIDVEELKLKAINGDVTAKDSKCKSLNISTISGDLDFKNMKVEKDVFANTVSGNIKISNSECSEIRLKTVSGDIKGNEFYPGAISLSSVSGDIKIVNSDESKPIRFTEKKSVSGNIKIILKQKS